MSASTTTRRPRGAPPPSIVRHAQELAALKADTAGLARQIRSLSDLASAVAGLQDSVERLTGRINEMASKPASKPLVVRVPKTAPMRVVVEVSGAGKQSDLLYGMDSIATALGVRKRIASYWKEKNGLPHFRVGATICARRSVLRAWLSAQEAAANG